MSCKLAHVADVGGIACGLGIEGGRKTHNNLVNAHLLHVAAHYGIYGKRLLWPATDEVGRHVCKEQHEVGLAERAVHSGVQLAWGYAVEGVEVHDQLSRE